MGVVTDRATFAQCFVFENERASLFAMTLGAVIIEPGHGEAAGGLEDVFSMGVMALNAVHLVFEHGMMLRQTEFGV
jgi:hypothetical protein